MRWFHVVPWLALVLFVPTVAVSQQAKGKGKSLEVEELVLKGKDGKVRGKLTGDGLQLTDAKGNSIEVALTATGPRMQISAGGYRVNVVADKDVSGLVVAGPKGDNNVIIGVEKSIATLILAAGARKIAAAVEVNRPMADLEVFDHAGKRRASFGLNSNGDSRLSLYDAAEHRRLYGIVMPDGTPYLDLNDNTGTPRVELFGADPKRGSGLSIHHNGKSAASLAVSPTGGVVR